MFKAATYLSAESELLLEILGPGFIGGLFLSMLGVLKAQISGLSGNVATARSQVSVSGLSGTCTIVGKCNIRDTFDALMPCTKDGVGQTSDDLTINLRDKRFDVTRQSSRHRNFHMDPKVYPDLRKI
ncbi:unnamed protein product [Brassica rapa]|uniref:Uncharacterized protein n=1 Tax=Brassica campestris TaxID=3711 RepID=A0A8D9M2Y8_BRACM|nr:unnamed protein product [Brassica rapa]